MQLLSSLSHSLSQKQQKESERDFKNKILKSNIKTVYYIIYIYCIYCYIYYICYN